MSNREHNDQIPSRRRPAQQLPPVFAVRLPGGNNYMRPFKGFLDLCRFDAMPGNMADIVHIPVEAANVAEQTTSIYNVRTYVGCADRIVFRVALRRRPSRQFVRPRPLTRSVPNGQDVNRLARVIDLEDNPVHVRPASAKQVPKRTFRRAGFRRLRTTTRHFSESIYGPFEAIEPTRGSRGLFRVNPPIEIYEIACRPR